VFGFICDFTYLEYERGLEAVELVANHELTKEAITLAGQLVVAAEYGPTDSGKNFHGPLAVREVQRRIDCDDVPEWVREKNLVESLAVRSIVNRNMRPGVEDILPPEKQPYEWYCDMRDNDQWRRFKGMFTSTDVADSILQAIVHPSGKVYATLLRAYRQNALNVIEGTGSELKRVEESELFGDFNANFLFAREFPIWLRKVYERDGPHPDGFVPRLIEGWQSMFIAQNWPGMRLSANDYGEVEGAVPAWMQMTAAYLRIDNDEQTDLQGENGVHLDRYREQYGNFMMEYLKDPTRPLTNFLPKSGRLVSVGTSNSSSPDDAGTTA